MALAAHDEWRVMTVSLTDKEGNSENSKKVPYGEMQFTYRATILGAFHLAFFKARNHKHGLHR
jgi:hypothetical protein